MLSYQSTSLSGDPEKFSLQQVIEIAEFAIGKKKPNMYGESRYTKNQIPLRNTPLTLIFRFHGKKCDEQSKLKYAKKLIRLGANVYEKFSKTSSTCREVKNGTLTTILECLMRREKFNEIAPYLTSQQLLENPQELYKVLHRLLTILMEILMLVGLRGFAFTKILSSS